jgi:hypothetical protein
MKAALGQDPLVSAVKPDQITAKPSYAALAQPVEHIIRNDGVRCSSHLSGTMLEFFVILFDYIAIRRLYIFFRLFYDALFTQRKTAVYGE